MLSSIKRLLAISAGVTLAVSSCKSDWGKAGDEFEDDDDPNRTTVVVDDPDAEVDLGVVDFNEWRRQRAQKTLHVAEEPDSPDEFRMAEIRDKLKSIDLGRRLFNDLSDTQTTMGGGSALEITDESVLAAYLYNIDAVILRDDAPPGRLLLHAAHELRHAWQDRAGLISDGKDMTLQNHAANLFMSEADARAFAVAVAWQFKQAGDSSVWDAAKNFPPYRLSVERFEDRMKTLEILDGTDLANSDDGLRSAMNAAYTAWFEPEDVRAPYVQGIIIDILRNGGSWSGDGDMPTDIAGRLGRLPGEGLDGADKSYLGGLDIGLAKLYAKNSFPTLEQLRKLKAAAQEAALGNAANNNEEPASVPQTSPAVTRRAMRP